MRDDLMVVCWFYLFSVERCYIVLSVERCDKGKSVWRPGISVIDI